MTLTLARNLFLYRYHLLNTKFPHDKGGKKLASSFSSVQFEVCALLAVRSPSFYTSLSNDIKNARALLARTAF